MSEVTPLEEIKDTWEAYRATLVREEVRRQIFRAALKVAVEAGVPQSEIAQALGIPRQHLHGHLKKALLKEAGQR